MRFSTRFALAAVGIVLTLSGCTAQLPEARVNPTEESISVRQQFREVNDKTAEAVRYFASKQRHDNMRGFLNYAGRLLMDKMLSGEIPYKTTHWNGSEPAPRDGWGHMLSEPSIDKRPQGVPYISLSVRFIDGKIDSDTNPVSIYIETPEYKVGFDGDAQPGNAGPAYDEPSSFSWYWRKSTGRPDRQSMSLQAAFIEVYYGSDKKSAPRPIEETHTVVTDNLHWNSSESIRENIQRSDNGFVTLLLDVVHEMDSSDWK